MMTFYIGKDYRLYEQKWKEISYSLAREMERKGLDTKSKAAVFRFMLDKIHKSLNKNKEN